MYGICANIWGILMVNVTIYSIHGSYGIACHLTTSLTMPLFLFSKQQKRTHQLCKSLQNRHVSKVQECHESKVIVEGSELQDVSCRQRSSPVDPVVSLHLSHSMPFRQLRSWSSRNCHLLPSALLKWSLCEGSDPTSAPTGVAIFEYPSPNSGLYTACHGK